MSPAFGPLLPFTVKLGIVGFAVSITTCLSLVALSFPFASTAFALIVYIPSFSISNVVLGTSLSPLVPPDASAVTLFPFLSNISYFSFLAVVTFEATIS